MYQLLTESMIQTKLSELTSWTLEGNVIKTTRKFANFIEAIAFVNKLVEPSESLGHHPDLSISYNKVMIELSTHDAGGLTETDFELARIISQL